MCNFTAFVRTAKALHINHEVDRCKWFTPQEARENIRPNSLAAEFLNAYLDEVGNKPIRDVIRGCATGILTESMEKSWFGLFRLTFL